MAISRRVLVSCALGTGGRCDEAWHDDTLKDLRRYGQEFITTNMIEST